MEKKNLNRCLLFVWSLFFIYSCVSPQSGPPSWTTTPPPDNNEIMHFVGVGTSASGNEAEARQAAVSQIFGSIGRFLGARVSATTVLKSIDVADKFEQTLTESITESSAAHIKGLEVVDVWVNRNGGNIDVYLLVAYSKKEMEAERSRLEALVIEKEKAVSRPENKGDAYLSDGKNYSAVQQFIKAMRSVLMGDSDNKEVRFERNLQKAYEAVEGINLEPLNNGLFGYLRQPLEPFKLKVSVDGQGLSGVEVIVTYASLGSGSRKKTNRLTVASNQSGLVEFSLPYPDLYGPQEVVMTLNIADSLGGIPADYNDQIQPLIQLISQKKAVFNYQITSHSAGVPSIIVFFDRDRAGKLMANNNAAAGLYSSLTSAGYNVALANDILRLPTAQTTQAILSEVKRLYGSTYKRIIIGQAQIVDFYQEDEAYWVRVSGDVKVIDTQTGGAINVFQKNKRARGSGEVGTIAAAFRGLGGSLGVDLVNTLL